MVDFEAMSDAVRRHYAGRKQAASRRRRSGMRPSPRRLIDAYGEGGIPSIDWRLRPTALPFDHASRSILASFRARSSRRGHQNTVHFAPSKCWCSSGQDLTTGRLSNFPRSQHALKRSYGFAPPSPRAGRASSVHIRRHAIASRFARNRRNDRQ